MMAERLFRAAAPDRHEARSAGVMPGHAPEPTVLEALNELGVDASDHAPSKLEQNAVEWADVVVATCDVDCPVVAGKRYDHWHMPDPYGRPLDDVRDIRDRIAARVDALVRELG